MSEHQEGAATTSTGAMGHRDFRLFWAARTVSAAGDQVTRLALPTVAILALGAGAAQVGALTASGTLAWPVLALVAGVWVDRLRRRRILVFADVGRALLVGSIPVAYALGHLTLVHLFVVAALAGGMTVFFELAAVAHTPALVPPEDWADANSKLEVAQQAIAVAGPGLAGVLISAVSAPATLLLDAASFLTSGGLIAGSVAGAPAPPVEARNSMHKEMAEGVRYLLADSALVRIMFCAAVSNVGLFMAQAVQLLFLYKVMHLAPFLVGICFGAAGVGSVIGAAYNTRVMNRLGVYHTLMLSCFVEGLGWALTPAGLFLPVVPLLVVGLFVSGFFGTTWNVSVTTFRQRRVRPDLMGRVTAPSRMVGAGALPVGALLGGALGQVFSARLGERHGLALTMALAALVATSSVLVLLGTRAFADETRLDVSAG